MRKFDSWAFSTRFHRVFPKISQIRRWNDIKSGSKLYFDSIDHEKTDNLLENLDFLKEKKEIPG